MHNVVKAATGDYGQGYLRVPEMNVSRDDDNVTITCSLDWIEEVNSTFVIPISCKYKISSWGCVLE